MTLSPSLVLLAALGLVGLAGCASSPDASPTDAGPTDAGPTDASPTDAGPTDAGPTDASTADASASQEAPLQTGAAPSMSLLGDGTRGGILILSFRADEAIALSETAACQIELGRGSLAAPLQAGPATQREGDRVVTQATYRLDAGAYAALSKAGSGTRVVVTIAGAARSYPWVRSDFLE